MSQAAVFTGRWTNFSHEGANAATWTLTVRDGAILLSAAAAFLTLVGSSFWAIVAFAIHQSRVRTSPQDGVHHQQQVIYRAEMSPTSTAWLLLRVCWAWRNRVRRNWIRMLGLALPPLLCFGAFTAASVLSSRVAAPSYAENEVLLKAKDCGFISWENISPAGEIAFRTAIINKARLAKDYARSCYTKSDTLNACGLYPVPALEYNITRNASCPFSGSDRCILGNNAAVQLATPWLDSHTHFGINEPLKNRAQIRKIVTCSPLHVGDFAKYINVSETPYEALFVGPVAGVSNFTFLHNLLGSSAQVGYQVIAAFASVNISDNIWQPVDAFKRTDADVTLIVVASNAIGYDKPVDDPLFKAHTTNPLDEGVSDPDKVYQSDFNLGVVGCTDQFQLRNPVTNSTTTVNGLANVISQSSELGLSNGSIASVQRLLLPATENRIYDAINGLNADSLLAQQTVYGLRSTGLPDDQWINEVKGWFETNLAGIQAGILEFASKDTSLLAPQFSSIHLPRYEPLRRQCQNQKIRNAGAYQSFSVLGLAIIAGVGGLILLLGACLSTLVEFIRRKTGRHLDKSMAWQSDSALQLQRVAFQGYSRGNWERTTEAIPVVGKGELLQYPTTVAYAPSKATDYTWQTTSEYGYGEVSNPQTFEEQVQQGVHFPYGEVQRQQDTYGGVQSQQNIELQVQPDAPHTYGQVQHQQNFEDQLLQDNDEYPYGHAYRYSHNQHNQA